MTVVKELGDVESAAGRPRRRLVMADIQRSHQVVSSQISKQPLTGLGVVVRHAQHVTCRGTIRRKVRNYSKAFKADVD